MPPKDLSLHGMDKITPWKLKPRKKIPHFHAHEHGEFYLFSRCLASPCALRFSRALLSFGWGKWGTSCTLVPFPLSLALRETVIYFVSRESQWLRPKKKEFVVRWRNAYYSYLPSTYVHTCGHETLSSIVWTLIPYVTLHFIEIGAAHNRALALSRPRALTPSRPRVFSPKSPFLHVCVNRSPIWYGFRSSAEAVRFSVNITSVWLNVSF